MLSLVLAVLSLFVLSVIFRSGQAMLEIKRVERSPLPPPVDTSCRLWEVRHTQMKMLDAGIITDAEMSICDNENCEACAKTKRLLEFQEGVAARQAADQYHKNKLEHRKQKELERRYRQVGDTSIEIPDNVPSYAHLETMHNPNYITEQAYWTWTDTITGKRMAMKSVFLPGLSVKSTEPFTRSNAERARRRQKRTQLGYM